MPILPASHTSVLDSDACSAILISWPLAIFASSNSARHEAAAKRLMSCKRNSLQVPPRSAMMAEVMSLKRRAVAERPSMPGNRSLPLVIFERVLGAGGERSRPRVTRSILRGRLSGQ